MNNKSLLVLLTAGLLASTPLLAQEDATPSAATDAKPDAPPPPMPSDEREEMEPQVTIIRSEDRTVEEYRINGQLYMVKVTPSKGYPYYLVDADGDGQLETRRNELDPKILVPSWVILRW
jgi:hypothetical protein